MEEVKGKKGDVKESEKVMEEMVNEVGIKEGLMGKER